MIASRQIRRQMENIQESTNRFAAASRPWRHLRFAPAVLIIFFGYVSIAMPLAVLPLQVHERLGFGTFVVGATIGIQSLVTLVTRQLAGSLCDRKGAKLVVLLGGASSLAAGLVYLFPCIGLVGENRSLIAILVARILLGVGESLFMTGSLAWSIGIVGPRNTGKVMVWVGIGMYGAVAIGAPLGIWLMTVRVAGEFVAVALGAILCSLLATLIGVFIAPVATPGGDRLPFVSVVTRIAPFGAGLALATLGFGAIAAFAALDFQAKGWPGAGFALSGFGAAYVVTRVTFGHWPDRFGGASIAVISLIVEACGQILLWMAPVPAVAFAGAIMTGAGFSLVFPSFGIEAVNPIPPANRGSALGAYAAFFDLGFALAGPASGLIAGAIGYPPIFAVGAASAILALLPAFKAARNRSY
jgi:MFS family permease